MVVAGTDVLSARGETSRRVECSCSRFADLTGIGVQEFVKTISHQFRDRPPSPGRKAPQFLTLMFGDADAQFNHGIVAALPGYCRRPMRRLFGLRTVEQGKRLEMNPSAPPRHATPLPEGTNACRPAATASGFRSLPGGPGRSGPHCCSGISPSPRGTRGRRRGRGRA